MNEIPGTIHFNFRLMIEELLKRGIKIEYIEGSDIVEAEYDGHVEIIANADTSLVPLNYADLISDKYLLKRYLQKKDVPVCEGRMFDHNELDLALFYAKSKLEFPVVIKPVAGSCGIGVFANIKTDEDFMLFFKEAASTGQGKLLVEKYFAQADDYRFFTTVTGYQAIVKRTPPCVVGDGVSSIHELVQAENNRRRYPRRTCEGEIWLQDIEGARMLSQSGYHYIDVLTEGKILQLRNNSNVYFGGQCEDVTDSVHPSYLKLTSEILHLFPQLKYAGIDLLARDITKPAQRDNYVVSEIEYRVGFSLHTHPGKGIPRNILTPIVDMLFPETKN
ncbi:MAG: hypothetical protein A2X42_06300 [Candidatus Margulisbacteria bacterium GWF2_38_17]|nr:MAG: hypothetical protein A2X42_06300 [Candidatus Margulisbacteria bacterium GWF2_38_17]